MPERVLVGVDIQPIEEVESSLRDFGDRYRHLLFTDHELEFSGDGSVTAARLAARFAAKEAVLKILRIGEYVPSWRSIEVRCTPGGRPEIVLDNNATEFAQLQGVHNFSVSLSHAGGVATAAVVASLMSEPQGV